jgi:hypothetical protein
MAALGIDTLKVSRRLREAGFNDAQAEAVITTLQETAEGADVATKADLAILRSELRETELRLESKIEGMRTVISETKADILTRVFAMIASAVVINVVAIVAAMIGVAKLLGH